MCLVVFIEDTKTGEEEIVETFQGQIPIGKTTEQNYLGFVFSSNGNNMANINALKKKSIGIVKKIMNELESLKLMNYYFECSLIFLNVMLRASLLYASECYYNLTEVQIRQIERIEDKSAGFSVKLLLSQPQERFAPKFKRNQDEDFF